ncbi:calcyphosin-like protein [Plasmopara halstedii]|uniref:6,7-dimethyl-8-ribityllumazine synthase n=1 Tax=Plasmopara halstedii TaxID=4781 RepID=A0A0P1AFV8_PLAHL|nr:calcyphosin-like protein [Plasmopara halstedii]CEG39694.1 calcyphosin-like protein [Plasmopara halstedii]|eukprot:XP_024576063.1 calcyphosin-like protein [Plasmopara halstedii]
MGLPRAAPVPAAVQMSAQMSIHEATGEIRIALIKTSSDAELVDRIVQNCFEILESQCISSETFTVPTVEQLPYAANKLTEFGGFNGALCFGFLNTQDIQFPALSAALTQSLIDISVKNACPIVPAVFVGGSRVASVKVKEGWGTEFADIGSLIQLGVQESK